MGRQVNRDRLSLEEIEQDPWGEPPSDATRLVRTAHELHRKPIGELSPEDLRLLIAQQVGTVWLMPRALALIADDPLAEGDFYPGDLLVAVMKLPRAYWARHPDQAMRLRAIIETVNEPFRPVRDGIDRFLAENVSP